MTIDNVNACNKESYCRQQYRTKCEHYLDCARYLPVRDQLLIEQRYLHGMTITQLAKLMDKPRQHVRRRLDRLVERMQSPLFRFMILYQDLLPLCTQRTARHVILHGCTLRETCEITGQTLHEVRQQMRTVKAMARV